MSITEAPLFPPAADRPRSVALVLKGRRHGTSFAWDNQCQFTRRWRAERRVGNSESANDQGACSSRGPPLSPARLRRASQGGNIGQGG